VFSKKSDGMVVRKNSRTPKNAKALMQSKPPDCPDIVVSECPCRWSGVTGEATAHEPRKAKQAGVSHLLVP